MHLQRVSKLIVFILLFGFGSSAFSQEQMTGSFPDSSTVMQQLFAFSADSMQGRSTTQLLGINKARNFIVNSLVHSGVPAYVPDYTQSFEIPLKSQDTLMGVNILAYVEGYSSDEIIVISAHYDHVGMKDSLQVFNGADDNASGTIALLEMAKYFSANQPEHDIIFAFFDAEEMGLLGAKHFVSSSVLDSSLVKLNVNMDMVARGDKNELFAVGTYFYPQLKVYINEAAQGKGIKMIYGADKPKDKPNWVQASDHGAFHNMGIPFVYFGVDDHKDYHKITDTADKVNPTFYLNAIRLIQEAVLIFDANLEYVTLNKK
jgi:Zn-dependent M28 family amino/carboxypeptidase